MLFASACEPRVKASKRGPKRAYGVCSLNGGSWVIFEDVSPEILSDARESFLDDAKSQSACLLTKEGDPIETSCICKPGAPQQKTSLGVVDFGDPCTATSQETESLLERLCERQLWSSCGPFAQRLERSCKSGWGQCSLDATSHRAGGGYHELKRECSCRDGRSWSESSWHRERLVLDTLEADSLCKKELEQCAPNLPLGPGPIPLVPDAFSMSQSIECGWILDGVSAQCEISFAEGDLDTSCRCGEESIDSYEAVDFGPSYSEKRELCHAAIEECLVLAKSASEG